jgi:hypothetical protein
MLTGAYPKVLDLLLIVILAFMILRFFAKVEQAKERNPHR